MDDHVSAFEASGHFREVMALLGRKELYVSHPEEEREPLQEDLASFPACFSSESSFLYHQVIQGCDLLCTIWEIVLYNTASIIETPFNFEEDIILRLVEHNNHFSS